jgi:hypothetical protein
MTVSNLVALLEIALKRREQRIKAIRDFQDIVNRSEELLDSETVDSIFRDLAYDLEFYVPVELHRAEDPSYFGDRKAKALIRKAIKLLQSQGVNVCKDGRGTT